MHRSDAGVPKGTWTATAIAKQPNATRAAEERKMSIRSQRSTSDFQSAGRSSTRQSFTLMLIGTVPRKETRTNATRAIAPAQRKPAPAPPPPTTSTATATSTVGTIRAGTTTRSRRTSAWRARTCGRSGSLPSAGCTP